MTTTKSRVNGAIVALLLGVTIIAAAVGVLMGRTQARPTTASIEEPPAETPAAAAVMARSPAGPRDSVPEPPRPPRPSGPDLRNAVGDAVAARTSQVRDAAGLSRLLVDLEAAARAKGRVTALEVEPGIAAIRDIYANDPAQYRTHISEFSERMGKLSRSLSPPPPAPEFVQLNRDPHNPGESQ
jgi:hypothetical protein